MALVPIRSKLTGEIVAYVDTDTGAVAAAPAPTAVAPAAAAQPATGPAGSSVPFEPAGPGVSWSTPLTAPGAVKVEEVTEHAINLLQVNPDLGIEGASKLAVSQALNPPTLVEKAGGLLPLAAVAGTIWLALKGGEA